jgi:hypothetical protein
VVEIGSGRGKWSNGVRKYDMRYLIVSISLTLGSVHFIDERSGTYIFLLHIWMSKSLVTPQIDNCQRLPNFWRLLICLIFAQIDR